MTKSADPKYKAINLKLTEDSYDAQFNKEYNEKYKIEPGDLRTYECTPSTVSLIVCDFVLHFFEDSEKAEFIKKFFSFLQPSGILYLRMNRTTHPEIINPENTIHLGNHSYKELYGDKALRTYHLTEPETLLKFLPSFHILPIYSEPNALNFTLVFQKELSQ